MSIKITDKVREMTVKQWGELMPKLQMKGVSIEKAVNDSLDTVKAEKQFVILSKYTEINGKRMLEVGSGLGVNIAVWTVDHHADCFGIEPESEGFESSYSISKELFADNGLDTERIKNATGEQIPFEDNAFDVVYSTNVLEHVADPLKVLNESLRVLKPGGVLQFVYPNYHSFFDGHYSVFHPPVLAKWFFPWYIKHICRRDDEFARTLRTELNVGWTKEALKKLSCRYGLEVLGMGEEVFYDRMKNLNFEGWGGLFIVKKIVEVLKRLRMNMLVAHICVFLGVFDPVILTVRKKQ